MGGCVEGAEGLRRPAGDGISRSQPPPPPPPPWSNVTEEPAEGLAEEKKKPPPSPSDARLRQAAVVRQAVARRWGVARPKRGVVRPPTVENNTQRAFNDSALMLRKRLHL